MPALMGEAHRRFGRLPWDRLLQPAIKLARDGVPVDYYLSLTITNGYENLARFPSSRELFFRPSGGPLAPPSLEGADWLVQPELAWTLEQIASDGPDTVYHGVVGERIVDQMEQHGGLITEEDLKSYRLLEHVPTRIDYRDYAIFGQIENSGVATVFQALKILEGLELHEHGFLSPRTVHIVLEAVRVAFRDRLRYLGDAELMPVPYRGVISSEYAAVRREEIDPSSANPQVEAGDPWQFETQSPPEESFRDGDATGGRTTHINVIDRDGNMVSLTSTIGGLNSGRTSTGVLPTWRMPRSSRPSRCWRWSPPRRGLG
jgi:gamma-glutamyltranspeptidase / glutathione hydrolase